MLRTATVGQLGFKFRDIKVILISHAHGDHCGAAREMPSGQVSRVLHDRDEVKVGGNTLVAALTPGYQGCTTWTPPY